MSDEHLNYNFIQQRYKQASSQYLNVSTTMSKPKQLVLLYDGVLKFLGLSREAIIEQKLDEQLNNLEKASSIILGLQSALDFDMAKDMSERINNFYRDILFRVARLERTSSLTECNEIIEDWREMRDSWQEIAQDY